MATISQTTRLSPFSQFQQYCTSIRLMLNGICEKTDTAFRRVHVMKTDEDGNIKLYDRKVKGTNGETQSIKDGKLSYVEDIKTGNMYLDEPWDVVAVKCALVALGMPVYTLGKMCWHTCKTAIEATTVALDTLAKAGQQCASGKFYEGAVEIGRGCSQLPYIIGDGLFEIVKAPLFGLGAELAALYGIIKPHHGKMCEALIEAAWQKGAFYKEDFRNVPARAGENCWEAFVKDVKDSHPFYLAHCFQVRGNVKDPHIIVIGREPLTH